MKLPMLLSMALASAVAAAFPQQLEGPIVTTTALSPRPNLSPLSLRNDRLLATCHESSIQTSSPPDLQGCVKEVNSTLRWLESFYWNVPKLLADPEHTNAAAELLSSLEDVVDRFVEKVQNPAANELSMRLEWDKTMFDFHKAVLRIEHVRSWRYRKSLEAIRTHHCGMPDLEATPHQNDDRGATLGKKPTSKTSGSSTRSSNHEATSAEDAQANLLKTRYRLKDASAAIRITCPTDIISASLLNMPFEYSLCHLKLRDGLNLVLNLETNYANALIPYEHHTFSDAEAFSSQLGEVISWLAADSRMARSREYHQLDRLRGIENDFLRLQEMKTLRGAYGVFAMDAARTRKDKKEEDKVFNILGIILAVIMIPMILLICVGMICEWRRNRRERLATASKADAEKCFDQDFDDDEQQEKAGLLGRSKTDDGSEAVICHVGVESACHGGSTVFHGGHGLC